MPLCYAGGQWLRLTRAEMLDYDVDPDEGKERDDEADAMREMGDERDGVDEEEG